MDKKPAVPKFASFKPKAESPPNSPAAPASSAKPKESDKQRRHHERERDREARDRRRGRHPKPDSQHHRHPSQRPRSRERKIPLSLDRVEPLFVVDKRGDPLIVRYGSNDRSKIPTYRRSGSGRVMGASGRLKLIYDGSRELFSLGNAFHEGASAFRDRNVLAKVSRKKTKVFRLRPEPDRLPTQSSEDEQDFVPLTESRKRKRGADGSGNTSGDEGPNYRSIQGKAKARDFVDSDLESADSSDSEAEADIGSSDPARKRSIELSRRVKEHPEDVDSWLELVELQEALLQLSQLTDQARTTDEVKALASMRLSLLEEALPNASGGTDKERILLRMMHEGSRVWSSKTLAKRWADINVKDSSLALWKAHVDYQLSSMATFTYDALKNVHLERIQYLRQCLSEKVTSSSSSQTDTSMQFSSICGELIFVLLRTTSFIRDAGYPELAMAAWQALLELTFARPRHESETSIADLMSSFRDFWESEVPRIGEEGAKGWQHFTDAEEMADLPEARTETAPQLPDTRDVYKAWAAVEIQRSDNAKLPARTLDEGTEDDPFRIVMFSDLEPLLFYVPPAALELEQVKIMLCNAFLIFCRLPPASLGPAYLTDEMLKDSFIYGESTGLESAASTQRHDEDGSKEAPRFSGPGRQFADSADVLFPSSNWFGLLAPDQSPRYDLVLRATTQLATTLGFESIAVYSLGMAYNENPNTIRKSAKALIKKWPNDTSLYNAYAVAEWRNGNHDTARNVLSSATSQDIPEKELLFTTWAWLELEAGEMKSALARCAAAASPVYSADAGPTTITYSQLLKARQSLSSGRDFLLSAGNIKQAAIFAQASMLLEYLSTFASSTESTTLRQGNIETAMESVQSFASEAAARKHGNSPDLERLLQSAAHLLYLHSTRGPFRPTYIREQLRNSITLFPSNTMFLTLFAWADTSLLLNDPVRDVLCNTVLTPPHDRVSSRIFAILHETAAGTVHSACTAFDRALDACRGSAGLWLSYVRFCHGSRKALLRGRAKDVYYRGISSCPWSKELVMEAFTTLAREMDSGELRSVFETMASKGLRVHVDLDEFTSGWASKVPGRRS